MSFQNEEDEEDLSPNLSSEEFNELTGTKYYKEEIINFDKENEILNNNNQEKEIDNYKIYSQSTNNIKETKNNFFQELNLSYADRNINLAVSNNNNNNNTNIETANFYKEENGININNNYKDNEKNINNNIQTNINIPINENKNQNDKNIDKSENNISQNYQSFLTERLNLINLNINDKEKNENNENENKEQIINNNDYYKYENFSKKDIMNYYFNLDNKINEINQNEEQYNIKNKIDNISKINNKEEIKEKNISLQKNDINLNVDLNNNNTKIINKIESKNKSFIDVSNSISEIQTNIKDSNLNKTKLNNITQNSTPTFVIENLNQNNNILKKDFFNNKISGFNTTKNSLTRNLNLEVNKSIDSLESVNIRRMDEEEEGRKIIIEGEYKKLSLLEKEKMKLIEEEKMVRKKIVEEIERQEDIEKKKEMRRIKYFEKVKKKEEDEKKLKDIKLKQEKELKEIYELKYKKKLEEEKLIMIIEGKLKLNNQEINNYKSNLQYNNNANNSYKENILSKDIIENKSRTISNNHEIYINGQLEKINNKKNITLDDDYKTNNNENYKNKRIKANQILNPSITLNKEKEFITNDDISISPSLSSFSNKNNSLNLKTNRNSIDNKYENKKSNLKQLISFSPSFKEESIKDNNDNRLNKYMTNNPKEDNWNLVDINMNNFYENKKKKYMKRKRAENNINYNTNVYNDKKVFQKLMDNFDSGPKIKSIKEIKDLNEVNNIQEITTKTKNEIDKTINAINNLNKNVKTINYNTERITINRNAELIENPYLKYGKKRLKQKKENHKTKSNKYNFNLNSRNFNGYFSDNYAKIKFPKSYKENNLDKIQNNENIDLNNYETISYANYKKYFENKKEKSKFNFDEILSDKNSKFSDYFKEIYAKNIK